jgi:hypothetical protein
MSKGPSAVTLRGRPAWSRQLDRLGAMLGLGTRAAVVDRAVADLAIKNGLEPEERVNVDSPFLPPEFKSYRVRPLPTQGSFGWADEVGVSSADHAEAERQS